MRVLHSRTFARTFIGFLALNLITPSEECACPILTIVLKNRCMIRTL